MKLPRPGAPGGGHTGHSPRQRAAGGKKGFASPVPISFVGSL